MKKQLFSYTLFCSLLIGSSGALGQKSYALGIAGGAVIPVGRLGDTQKTGYNATATLAIGVSDLPIGVRFDGRSIPTRAKIRNTAAAARPIPRESQLTLNRAG